MSAIKPLRILPGEGVEALDQTLLPHEERRLRLRTVAAVAEAIRALRVRGAPLLGVTGACGMAIAGEERGAGREALARAAAWRAGRIDRCYATETRPLLQGARLTMWELKALGVPATLLPDAAAASLIASGRVGAVVTGADRIAANGDAANKVGTYALALAAARHGAPFYVAAPRSTFDAAAATGADIPIEFRDAAEVGGFGDRRWSPAGGDAWNPAFDVTPADLIAAIVTERGALRPPYGPAIAALTGAAR